MRLETRFKPSLSNPNLAQSSLAKSTLAPAPLVAITAWRSVDATIEAGVRCYQRQQHLPPLLKLWPHDLTGAEPGLTAAILDQLRKALQQQRRRARQYAKWQASSGYRAYPCYDVNRHIALLQAWRAESRYWRAMKA
jgi:hypothetical protein